MENLEELRKKMAPYRLTHMAHVTGLSYGTIWRFRHGKVRDDVVSYDTVLRIHNYIQSKGMKNG